MQKQQQPDRQPTPTQPSHVVEQTDEQTEKLDVEEMLQSKRRFMEKLSAIGEPQREEEEQASEFPMVTELGKVEAEPSEDTARKTPGLVTRVVANLMVFVEVSESDSPLGLVFKPDKIVNYHGELLEELGIKVGSVVSEINWDTGTLKVSSVNLKPRTESRPMSASA